MNYLQNPLKLCLSQYTNKGRFLDDIMVTGSTEAEHWANAEVVLIKLEEAGLRLNRDKCEFGVREVVYLGHRMSVEG